MVDRISRIQSINNNEMQTASSLTPSRLTVDFTSGRSNQGPLVFDEAAPQEDNSPTEKTTVETAGQSLKTRYRAETGGFAYLENPEYQEWLKNQPPEELEKNGLQRAANGQIIMGEALAVEGGLRTADGEKILFKDRFTAEQTEGFRGVEGAQSRRGIIETLAETGNTMLENVTDEQERQKISNRLYNELVMQFGTDDELLGEFVQTLRDSAADENTPAENREIFNMMLSGNTQRIIDLARGIMTGDVEAQAEHGTALAENVQFNGVIGNSVHRMDDGAVLPVATAVAETAAAHNLSTAGFNESLQKVESETLADTLTAFSQNDKITNLFEYSNLIAYTNAERQLPTLDLFNERAVRDNDADLLNANAGVVGKLHADNKPAAFQSVLESTKNFSPEQVARVQTTLADQIEKAAPKDQSAMHEAVVKNAAPEVQQRAAENIQHYSVASQAPALVVSFDAAINAPVPTEQTKSLAQMVADSIAYNQSAKDTLVHKPALLDAFVSYQDTKKAQLADFANNKPTAYRSVDTKPGTVHKISESEFKTHSYTEQIDIISRMINYGDKMKALELAFASGLGSHVLNRLDAAELLSNADGKFRNDILTYLCTSNKMEDKLAMAEYIVNKNDEDHPLYEEAQKIRADFGVEQIQERQPLLVNS